MRAAARRARRRRGHVWPAPTAPSFSVGDCHSWPRAFCPLDGSTGVYGVTIAGSAECGGNYSWALSLRSKTAVATALPTVIHELAALGHSPRFLLAENDVRVLVTTTTAGRYERPTAPLYK